LGSSSGDHKHFFDSICLFWEDQHQEIKEAIAQAKVKIRTAHNIQLFQDVINFVHPYCLNLILQEKGKLPLKSTDPLPDCVCTVSTAYGIPCFHTIRARQETGLILLSDIDAHWHYERAAEPVPQERRILLNPAKVKNKGRPKGAKGKGKKLPHCKGEGEPSTRRDPSLHEYAAIDLPSATAPPPSTAPPRLETEAAQPPGKRRKLASRADATITNTEASLPSTSTPTPRYLTRSTTKLALERGAGGPNDPYDPGTLHQRAYMRSIHPDKLAEADDYEEEEESSDKEEIEEDGEELPYEWEVYKQTK
jgi:hypothetical protein